MVFDAIRVLVVYVISVVKDKSGSCGICLGVNHCGKQRAVGGVLARVSPSVLCFEACVQ